MQFTFKTILISLLFASFTNGFCQVVGTPLPFFKKASSGGPTNPIGAGTFNGKTCFDIALGNDDLNGCAPISGRASNKSDFTQTSTNTQTYIFVPAGTVSNVRFSFINRVGEPIVSISGGNSGNNISTFVTVTVTYNSNLNTLAAGLTENNALSADIYVIYNDGATNNGSNKQLKLTPIIKDCACCGAFIAPTIWRNFLCHNLGADTSLDPHDLTQANAVLLHGAQVQFGRRGPNVTGDSRVDWRTAANSGPTGFAAAPTAANGNAGTIFGWFTTSSPTNLSWVTNGRKNTNDPCPGGYRVPTAAEWTGVGGTSNSASKTGTWLNNNTNYGSGIHYGPSSGSRTLTLPSAGNRAENAEGFIQSRGNLGRYWSSDIGNNGNYGRMFITFSNLTSIISEFAWQSNGTPIRCIEDVIPSASIATIDCTSSTPAGTFTFNTPVSATSTIPYTGGNGGIQFGMTVSSTGVTGLTATIAPSFVANGNGSFTVTFSGTPEGFGTASFAISILGKTCTINKAVGGQSQFLISLNEARVSNSTNHAAVFASDGNLYTWGEGADGQLGLNSTVSYPRNPRLVITNLSGKKIIQSATGYWGSSVALTDAGEVFYCGPVLDGGNGQRIFTRALLGGGTTIKALLMSTSEGGTVIIADNDKMYGLGYYNVGTGTGQVREIAMPSGATTNNVRFLTGSHHWTLLTTTEKLFYIAGQQGTNWGGISATFTEYTTSTFTKIEGISAAKNLVVIKDNGTFKYTPNRNTATTNIDISSINEPIKSFYALDNLVVFVTDTKFTVFNTSTNSYTFVNLPANSVLEWASPEKITGSLILCKFRNTVTNAVSYQTFGRVAITNGPIANSAALAFSDANLNLNQLPAGVTF